MQAFTKIEIKWVIDELEAEMKQLKSLSAVETGPHVPCISCGPNNWTLSLASCVQLSKPETSALRSSIKEKTMKFLICMPTGKDGIQDDAVIRNALLTAVNRITLMDEKSGEFEAGDGNQNMVTFEVSE